MRLARTHHHDKVPLIPEEDLARVNGLLRAVGGPNVSWGAANVLDVWLTETRLQAERRSARRIEIATWALVGVTLVLALATVGLIVATVTSG